MNAGNHLSCRRCGSLETRWVSSLLAVWDGIVVRCSACRDVQLVPTTSAGLDQLTPDR
jgi:hypothetical protein